MAWSDIFLKPSSQTADEQQANYARLQQLNAERLKQREAAGNISQARIDANQAAERDSLNSQDLAAGLGLVQGATEGLYDPAQWWTDTKAGAQIAGEAADSAYKGVWSGLTAALKKILGPIPWWVWLAAAGALFIWMGGLALLKGRFAR